MSSFDGTGLAMRSLRTEGTATSVLVVPAVGATTAPWRRVALDVASDRAVLTWDLRGLHESAPPASARVDPGAHAEDAAAVLDHAGVETAAIASWSSGTRIALEFAHRYPDRCESLVLVCGAYGYALPRLVNNFEAPVLLPLLAGVAKHFASAFGIGLRTLTARPEFSGLLRQSGLVAGRADISSLAEMFRGMAGCDPKRLLHVYEAVTGDAAPEILPEIRSPALLIAAERDPFTPRAQMEHAARLLPFARLVVYEDTTHYLPFEQPGRLAADLTAFVG